MDKALSHTRFVGDGLLFLETIHRLLILLDHEVGPFDISEPSLEALFGSVKVLETTVSDGCNTRTSTKNGDCDTRASTYLTTDFLLTAGRCEFPPLVRLDHSLLALEIGGQ